MKTPTVLICLFFLGIFLIACSQNAIVNDNAPDENTQANKNNNSSGNVQIANPASVNCINNGGKLKMMENEQGTYGICVLPSGTECEEWAYFRGECPVADEKSCNVDSDCACGTNIKTGECFMGNIKYVNTTQQCPDFCTWMGPNGSGSQGNKCINNKCE